MMECEGKNFFFSPFIDIFFLFICWAFWTGDAVLEEKKLQNNFNTRRFVKKMLFFLWTDRVRTKRAKERRREWFGAWRKRLGRFVLKAVSQLIFVVKKKDKDETAHHERKKEREVGWRSKSVTFKELISSWKWKSRWLMVTATLKKKKKTNFSLFSFFSFFSR